MAPANTTFVLLRLPVDIAAGMAASVSGLEFLTPSKPPEKTALPAVLRKATAFIEAHPESHLTVAQIAAAAGVGIRALQTSFRLHLAITPMTYLRRVRLDHVHRELLAGDPHDGVTVQGVARRWGFVNLGRFAADYRTEYGVTPRETLRV
ncbi:helix-turn-helix transcriptional regulator [Actinoplanes sp. LDG1-06]|uniref:Helix-turn-helix transcriptional regulator n=1 Tax=Paractinoplanes ovalisporus TaxID=2810368 RepID=A0ABS2AN14_9ACTN|nr:helix-turn-helix transcriptional regulator [Actinoplanes ovalisporus]MBM2621242.1 helix-turn-helix transcriptional regulator [Actinoplanes ovalisporus]